MGRTAPGKGGIPREARSMQRERPRPAGVLPEWDSRSPADTVGRMPTSDTVITDELAVEIARLGLVRESSDVATLDRVTRLAARAVAGCAGATGLRWTLGDPPRPLAA